MYLKVNLLNLNPDKLEGMVVDWGKHSQYMAETMSTPSVKGVYRLLFISKVHNLMVFWILPRKDQCPRMLFVRRGWLDD